MLIYVLNFMLLVYVLCVKNVCCLVLWVFNFVGIMLDFRVSSVGMLFVFKFVMWINVFVVFFGLLGWCLFNLLKVFCSGFSIGL